MTTVFLSGSRTISRLNRAVRDRVQNIIDQDFNIVLGDASGADKSLQQFLAEKQYRNVTVFCAGNDCRHNLGRWPTRRVSVDSPLKGREFYAQKDRKMADEADYGLVVWDGKSYGSMSNVFELAKRGKHIVVYHSPTRAFIRGTKPEDVRIVLRFMDPDDYISIAKKYNINKHLEDLQLAPQGRLNL